MKSGLKELPDIDRQIVEMRNAGMTFKAIGVALGRHPQTVLGRYNASLQFQKRIEGNDPLLGLSVKACNALNNAGLLGWDRITRTQAPISKPDIKAAVERWSSQKSRRPRNCGDRTLNELRAFVGLPKLEKKQRLCPHCGKPL